MDNRLLFTIIFWIFVIIYFIAFIRDKEYKLKDLCNAALLLAIFQMIIYVYFEHKHLRELIAP